MWRLSFAFVLACGGGPRARPVTNHTDLPPRPAPIVTCYAGTQRARAGEVTALVLRRTVDEEHAKITEEWTRDSGSTFTRTSSTVWNVVGNRYTVEEHGQPIATGVLHGPPWRWTSWTTMFPAGAPDSVIAVSTEVTPAGLHGNLGVPESEQSGEQELATIDCARYDDATRRLAPVEERVP